LTTKTIADANLQKATNEKPLADETCELMKAQFRSRCGRCGHIWPREKVWWAHGRQSIHATFQGCRIAGEQGAAEEVRTRVSFDTQEQYHQLMELIRSVDALPGTGDGARLAHWVSTHSTRSTQSFNHHARRRRRQ
jgi:hypothetical protein